MDKRIYAFETIILFRGDLTASEFDSKATEYRHHVLEGDVLCAEKIPSTIYDIEKIGLKKLAYKTKGCESGWYLKFTYKTVAERVNQLEKFFRADSTVIKYLTMKLTEDEAELLDDEKTISEQPGDYNPDPQPHEKEVDAFDLIFGEI